MKEWQNERYASEGSLITTRKHIYLCNMIHSAIVILSFESPDIFFCFASLFLGIFI